MPSFFRPALLLCAAAFCASTATSCAPAIDCEALCARTLACEVTFGPSDDPDGAKIKSGERSDDESCAIGCEESPRVTVDNARCIDALEITSDPAQCQAQVMECLGLAEQL
jgi:hypothetical protein